MAEEKPVKDVFGNMRERTMLSLFDGSGGFPLAGSLCGVRPVAASEVEPYPIAVTRSRFPSMKHLGSVTDIHGGEIEPVDIITFGSPCQDLSVAGKRAGLKHEANGDEETTRSGLFMEAVRIIKEMREATNGQYPTFALWENVPGAFSSNKGEDFRTVLAELINIVEPGAVMPSVPKAGWTYADSYTGAGWSLAYRVFDAQYWGVPQRRRRIHLVVDFRGERAREVLFEREGVRGYFTQGRTPWQGAAADPQGGSAPNDREGESAGNGSGRGLDAVKAYSFDSLASNSMKSKNPNSGCRQVEVAKTLDTTDPNPSKNQGGIAIVETRLPDVISVEMEIATRKHEVDKDKLVALLRDHKGGWTYKTLAEALNKPETEVAHWFRTDNCFSVPDADVWYKLKGLLGIKTTEFDAVVTEFEYKGGNYDMRNRIHTGEVAPTLTCGSGSNLHLLPQETVYPNTAQTLTARHDSSSQPDIGGGANVVVQPGDPCHTLSTDGRNYAVYCLQGNGIDRADTAGCNGKGWKEDTSYTLNTIDRPAVAYLASGKETVGTLMANAGTKLWLGNQKAFSGDYHIVEETPSPVRYIVRRLTPTECARLQGFADRWGDIDEKADFTDEEYSFWLNVRNTHAAINGKQVKEYTKAQMLTWYNKLHTDGAEYKMWGNGIALPPALYCMQGMVDALNGEEDEDWML